MSEVVYLSWDEDGVTACTTDKCCGGDPYIRADIADKLAEALEKSNEHLHRLLIQSMKNDIDHAPSPLSNQVVSNRAALEAYRKAKGE